MIVVKGRDLWTSQNSTNRVGLHIFVQMEGAKDNIDCPGLGLGRKWKRGDNDEGFHSFILQPSSTSFKYIMPSDPWSTLPNNSMQASSMTK